MSEDSGESVRPVHIYRGLLEHWRAFIPSHLFHLGSRKQCHFKHISAAGNRALGSPAGEPQLIGRENVIGSATGNSPGHMLLLVIRDGCSQRRENTNKGMHSRCSTMV